jgi:hypothetical protein
VRLVSGPVAVAAQVLRLTIIALVAQVATAVPGLCRTFQDAKRHTQAGVARVAATTATHSPARAWTVVVTEGHKVSQVDKTQIPERRTLALEGVVQALGTALPQSVRMAALAGPAL